MLRGCDSVSVILIGVVWWHSFALVAFVCAGGVHSCWWCLFVLVAFALVALVCAGGIHAGGIHSCCGICLCWWHLHRWHSHQWHLCCCYHCNLSYTVSNKTVAMFAMFDFLCLFLHNLSLKISEIFQEATHASCLHVCHVSWNSMEI